MGKELSLDGPEQPPISDEPADRLVVFLHGLGANGQDLIGLAPILAKLFPRAHFLSPNAPFACDIAPVGLQWFSLQDLSPHAIRAGVERAAPILDHYLDQQLARFDLTADRLVLVGFSQGTMMSLHVGPRRQACLGGVLGFSGTLVAPELLETEQRSRPPVFLAHGDADNVVPVDGTIASAETLKHAGFDVGYLICEGTEHTIDERGLHAGAVFLQNCFGEALAAEKSKLN